MDQALVSGMPIGLVIIIMICNDNYGIESGNGVIQCQPDGKFDLATIPVCKGLSTKVLEKHMHVMKSN